MDTHTNITGSNSKNQPTFLFTEYVEEQQEKKKSENKKKAGKIIWFELLEGNNQ